MVQPSLGGDHHSSWPQPSQSASNETWGTEMSSCSELRSSAMESWAPIEQILSTNTSAMAQTPGLPWHNWARDQAD